MRYAQRLFAHLQRQVSGLVMALKLAWRLPSHVKIPDAKFQKIAMLVSLHSLC